MEHQIPFCVPSRRESFVNLTPNLLSWCHLCLSQPELAGLIAGGDTQ